MITSGQTTYAIAGFLIAQAEGGDAAAPAQGAFGWGFFLPLILIMVVWYFLMIRPQNAERAKRQEILKALKKNDRVITTSGMLGTVANISQDGKEITLKFGDAVRIPFLRSAIETVVVPESTDSETAGK